MERVELLKKSLILILLSLALFFVLAACGGADGKGDTETEVNDGDQQGLTFTLKRDGSYPVGIGDAKKRSKIVIPATYDGKAVTEVGKFGCISGGNTILREVVIGDGIKVI